MRRERRLIRPARGSTTALPIFEDVGLARTPDLRITRMPSRIAGRSTSTDSTTHSAEGTG